MTSGQFILEESKPELSEKLKVENAQLREKVEELTRANRVLELKLAVARLDTLNEIRHKLFASEADYSAVKLVSEEEKKARQMLEGDDES